jgi:hypothetical protein
MKRRTSIKLIPALGFASVWLSSCKNEYLTDYAHIKISEEDKNIIDTVRKSILPYDVKGSQCTDFVLRYADKIISTEKRNTFSTGFQELKHKLKGALQYKVENITPETVTEFWNEASNSSELIKGFLEIVKSGAVHYYKSEKKYQIEKMGFILVPGEFQPCVKIG